MVLLPERFDQLLHGRRSLEAALRWVQPADNEPVDASLATASTPSMRIVGDPCMPTLAAVSASRTSASRTVASTPARLRAASRA